MVELGMTIDQWLN